MSAEPEKLLVPAELYDEALVFCNARRAERGMEPITELPAGYGGSPTTCPCANGAGLLYVNRDWWSLNWDWWSLICDGQRFGGTPIGFIDFFDWHTNYGVLTLPVRDGSLKEESRNG